MDTKPLLFSKTVWSNIVTLLITVLTVLVNDEWVKQHPTAVAIITAVIFVLQNVVMRYITASAIKGIIGLFVAVSLGAALAPAEIADAGIFRRANGEWRKPVRTFIANRAQARESRGAVALFPGLRAAACSSCSAAAANVAASDCVECVDAERVSAAANAARNRLDLGIFRLASTLSMRRDLTAEERVVVRRMLVDREFRLHIGEALKARYGDIGDGTLLQILQYIIQNREDLVAFIKMLIEIAALF